MKKNETIKLTDRYAEVQRRKAEKREPGTNVVMRDFPDTFASMWQAQIGEKGSVEGVAINGRMFIIHEYGDGNGWEAYAPVSNSNTVDGTIDAIAQRANYWPKRNFGQAEIGDELPEHDSYIDAACKATPHFYAVTSKGTWGRAFTIDDAIRNSKSATPGTIVLVYHVDAGTEIDGGGGFMTAPGRRRPTLLKRLVRKGTKWAVQAEK